MTRKGMGLAKKEIIRIHDDDRLDLNWIKGDLKMNSSHNEGDVVHQLIKMYKKKIIR
jgi:hypothetical protein